MGLEALKAIHNDMSRTASYRPVLILAAAASLVVLILLVHVFVSHYRRQRRVEGRWRELSEFMTGCRLSAAERELLVEMARREFPDDPLWVTRELPNFERAVQRHFKPLQSAEQQGRATREAAAARSLRGKLAFAERPGLALCSTRELAAGQEMSLSRSATAEAGSFCAGRLAEQREDVLLLTGLTAPDALRGATAAHVTFTTAGRLFKFQTDLIDVDPVAATCRLAHCLDVRLEDARRFLRVKVERQVTFRAVWEAEDVARQATLRDLSAGGAALVSRPFYEEGERLLLHLKPADYLDDAEDGAEPRMIPGVAIKAERLPEGRCLYRVEFRDVAPADTRFLFQVVQKLDRGRGEPRGA